MSNVKKSWGKLAFEGGPPVRDTGLPPSFPGAVMYGEEEKEAVLRVIESQSPFRYYGPQIPTVVKDLETRIADRFGSRHALCVTSGTASLIVALKAAGIGPGDKVIVPAITFLATAGAVVAAGAVPIFADVDDSLNMDPETLDALIDPYVRAVIPVPILGNPCNMDAIMRVAQKRGLLVIEDVAQSCGSRYRGRYSGTFGDIGCFSLQINKILTTGDGGFLITENDSLYERAVRYHDQGMFREREGFLTKNVDDVFLGQNYRMSELTGAIARVQMDRLDTIITSLKRVKKAIKEGVSSINGLTFRRINDKEGDASNALVMLLPDEETARRFIQALNSENIPASSLYGGSPVYMIPQLLHRKTVDKNRFPFNQFHEEITYYEGLCPTAESLMPRNACLMLSPLFTNHDISDIVEGIHKVAAHIL